MQIFYRYPTERVASSARRGVRYIRRMYVCVQCASSVCVASCVRVSLTYNLCAQPGAMVCVCGVQCVCAAQPRAMEAISSLPSWCSRLPAVAMHAHTREQPAPCTVHPTTLIEPYTMSYGWCSRLPAGPRAPTKHLNPRAECTQLGCRAEFRAPHS